MEILVDEILEMSWECARAAQEADCTLVHIKRNMASGSREVILSLY